MDHMVSIQVDQACRSKRGGKVRKRLPVFVLVLLVDAAHKSGSGGEYLVHEDEDGLLRGQLDPFPDHVDELANGEICRDKIFFLVDSSNITFLDFLADDLREGCYVSSCSRWRMLRDRSR